MNYEVLNLEEECKSLLRVIEEDCRKASAYRNQIDRLKKANLKQNTSEINSIEEEEIYIDEDNLEEENTFEDEVSYYLQDFRMLEPGFTESEFIETLPSKKHYEYQNIINRLIAESIKDIKELRECIYEEESLSKEELKEYNILLSNELRKIEMLKETLTKSTDQEEEEIKNTLVLVPTEAGNIRVLDELERVPLEYHAKFLELLNSIIDGTFKNVKSFTNNNNLNGISEVKVFGARVVFTRISKNHYAILTAFIKKCFNDKAYAETLKSKVSDYKKNPDKAKQLLDNEEFMEENNKNVEYLLEFLSEEKKKVKGGLNE